VLSSDEIWKSIDSEKIPHRASDRMDAVSYNPSAMNENRRESTKFGGPVPGAKYLLVRASTGPSDSVSSPPLKGS
jgi:hypothetical protein